MSRNTWNTGISAFFPGKSEAKDPVFADWRPLLEKHYGLFCDLTPLLQNFYPLFSDHHPLFESLSPLFVKRMPLLGTKALKQAIAYLHQ